MLVVDTFPVPSQTFIAAKVAGLVGRGMDVHVLCTSPQPGGWDSYPELAADTELRRRVHRPTEAGRLDPVHHLRSLARSAVRSPGPVARAVRAEVRQGRGRILRRAAVVAALGALRPDVVHFEFGVEGRRWTHLARTLGCPITVSFRGWDLNYAFLDQPAAYREVWTSASAVHCLGQDLWARAIRRGCPPSMPHALIPPAVDTHRFSPGPRDGAVAGTPGRPLRVLAVGRLHWKKGYEDALGALALLTARGVAVEYRVVGDGDHAGAVAACVVDRGLGHVVRLLGAVPHHEVPAQVQWADVLLHAAVSEGFCNAVVEAQAMALPVVCTDADGLAENVIDGRTGFVVRRRDHHAMADRLQTLAADPGLRARLGSAGRERASDLFQLDRQLDAWEQFYERVTTVAADRSGRAGGPGAD